MRELRKQKKTHRAELLYALPTVARMVILRLVARRAGQVALSMKAAAAREAAAAAARQGHRVMVQALAAVLVDHLEEVQAATVETVALQEATTAEAEVMGITLAVPDMSN